MGEGALATSYVWVEALKSNPMAVSLMLANSQLVDCIREVMLLSNLSHCLELKTVDADVNAVEFIYNKHNISANSDEVLQIKPVQSKEQIFFVYD